MHDTNKYRRPGSAPSRSHICAYCFILTHASSVRPHVRHTHTQHTHAYSRGPFVRFVSFEMVLLCVCLCSVGCSYVCFEHDSMSQHAAHVVGQCGLRFMHALCILLTSVASSLACNLARFHVRVCVYECVYLWVSSARYEGQLEIWRWREAKRSRDK